MAEEQYAAATLEAPRNEKEGTAVVRTDQNESFSIRVKPDYILQEPSPVLSPWLYAESARNDDRDGTNQHKRNKGMNKKRPRDPKQEQSLKMCTAAMRGEACPYGVDKCRFSHDLKEALTNRPDDITQIEGGCPNFNLKGFCEYGVICRLGASHLNLATGDNLSRGDVAKPDPVKNSLTKDVQTMLRKKKYPFKCKRRNKHSGERNGEATSTRALTESAKTGDVANGAHIVQEATADPIIDFSPLPQKRKLIDFQNRVYVAPLTTVGNLPFRRIMKKFGADITCGEMAVSTCLLDGKMSEWALLKRHPEEDLFGIQLAAGHPDQFMRACELIEAHTTVDFVDMNLGCPLDLLCERGAGAKLMLRDNKLRESVQGITSILSCPITIKMRTGWNEAKPFAHELVPKIQSWGIDGIAAIMVHGRSRLQRYQKPANWDYIEKVAASQTDDFPRIPVIGNGDIYNFTDFEEQTNREGINTTAMLARGALIKPWLPREIKERKHIDISSSERLDILKDFVRFGLEHWGSDQKGVNNTRRFLLEWLSFLYRYIPVGLLEVHPTHMNQRPPANMCGRNDLETLMMSKNCLDWIKISEMLLGPVPEYFQFEPKHKANAYK